MRTLLLSVLISFVFVLQTTAQTVKELTDRKDIAFAWKLPNYDGTTMDSLRFDIYYPTGAMSNKKYPVYFSLHGGSFTTATKTSVMDISDAFADYGFIVVAPDYRVGYYHSTFPCQDGGDSARLQEAIYRAVQDVNACIRYIANHASEYNVDTSGIFIGGSSAGGTLALNDAYLNDSVAAVRYPNTVANWGTLQTTGNNEPYNYKIKGIAAMWGGMPYWDSLINSKSAIPTILYKGGKDSNLPNGIGYYQRCTLNSVVRAGIGIYSVMTALKKPCVYHFQPSAGHTAYDDAFCIDNASCFFKAIMNGTPYSGYYEYYDPSCK
jgi:acetyl esterase/lipase